MLTGCATILHGTRQEISIATNPSETSISDGEITIKSPGKLNLKRGQDHILTLEDKLKELDHLKEKKAITDEEYKTLREITLHTSAPPF